MLSETVVFVKVIVIIRLFLIKVFSIYGSHDLHLRFVLPRTQYMTTAKAQILRVDAVSLSKSGEVKKN